MLHAKVMAAKMAISPNVRTLREYRLFTWKLRASMMIY